MIPGGSATIAIQVDSKQRWEIDAMFGFATYTDIEGGFSDMSWGGIWGHVYLEDRSDAWVSDLFVQTSLAASSCSVSASINGRSGLVEEARLEVFDQNGHSIAQASGKPQTSTAAVASVTVATVMPEPMLWTPRSPTLYKARLSLMRDGQVIDCVESRFGVREFTVDGHRLLLNGKQIMLRGYGDDHVYVEDIAMPATRNSTWHGCAQSSRMDLTTSACTARSCPRNTTMLVMKSA